MKLTPIRKEILDILESIENPINAKIIRDKFKLDADFSNIYRNLNSLELQREINSISIDGVKFYYKTKEHNGHFIICKNCGEIKTFHNCHEHKLKDDLEKEFSYKLITHNLYFEGYCEPCNKAIEKKQNNLGGK